MSSFGVAAEMKKMMLTIGLLSFFSFWMLPADSKMIPPRFNLSDTTSDDIHLSMMEDSVDDMYVGCAKRMTGRVDKYMKEEKKGIFGEAWNQAKQCAEKGLKIKNRPKKLKEDHIRAICAYTAENKNKNKKPLYEQFNEATRDGGLEYNPAAPFKFHSLHFLLTEAIQILKDSQEGKMCTTVYRRSTKVFTGDEGKEIRFGQFSSSSTDPNLNSIKFGKKTCFIIKTCFGAALKEYPTLGNVEKEVLIPPYEVFVIVKSKPIDTIKITSCEHFIKIESIGILSNLNSKAIPETSNGIH